MSNGKSDRKKLGKVLATIIILVIAGLLGLDVSNIIPIGTGNEPTSMQQDVNSDGSKSSNVEGNLVLHMIDVGQADSFLLVQNGKTALFDCGTRSTGEDVVKYLNELGITKLDYLIGSHPHDDHMGGMYDVITNFEIGTIIMPKVKSGDVTSNWYIKLMQEIKDGKYNVEYPEVGNVYSLGDAALEVIGPISEPKGNLNNYSVVFRVTFGNMDIIMTGDLEKDAEREIIASEEYLDAEILKVGHHGSDTSSCDEWLDEITPEYALISTKVGNKYNHPIKSVMENLEERNIEVYRTDEQGTVIVTITANDAIFSCEPADYLSGEEVEKREVG